jgi:hypothetical protein
LAVSACVVSVHPASPRSRCRGVWTVALVTGLALLGLVAAQPASANHEGTPTSVSVAPAQTSVTIPASIKLTVSADRDLYGTGYRVSVIDEDNGITLGSCSGTCDLYGGTSWADNSNPQPRHFHGELRGPDGGLVATSGQVTVEVRKHVWSVVSVVPNPTSRVVPGSIQFVATLDHTTYGTPYSIYIYDEDDPAFPTTCNQYICGRYFNRQWADNLNPKPARVRVEVRNASGDVASNTVVGFAQFRRFIFSPSLSFSSQTGTNGSVIHKATVTTPSTDPSLYGTPYRIKIKKADGSEVCSSPQVGCTATVNVGQTYRGVVEDSQGRNFGQSTAWTMTESGPQAAQVGDVDLAALAAAAGGVDICTRLALSPLKTDVIEPQTSAGDQWEVCAAAAAAGASAVAVLLAVADTPGGEANLLWLQADVAKEAPSAESEPDPDDATAPRPVPPPFLPDVYKLAQKLAQNQDIPQSMADEVANQCLFLHWRAGLSGKDDCGELPIFASGSDVPEATVHDLQALAYSFRWVPLNAQWVRLNYRHQDLTPGYRYWMNSEDECQGRVPGVTACDEYPFWATMQGGPESIPRPHLKLIDFIDNRDQGLRYGNFIQACHMATGDPFLGIPLAPELGIPTQTKLCNGH